MMKTNDQKMTQFWMFQYFIFLDFPKIENYRLFEQKNIGMILNFALEIRAVGQALAFVPP